MTLENGLTVRVRAFSRGTRRIVIADAVRSAATQEYDRKYQESIASFQEAWHLGQRDEELLLPRTGAEVFMVGLYCESIASTSRDAVRFDSKLIGGTGTEWRVRWNIDDHFPSRFRVGDSSENYVPVTAAKYRRRIWRY